MQKRTEAKKTLKELILEIIGQNKFLKKENLYTEIELMMHYDYYEHKANTKLKYAINRILKSLKDDALTQEYETDFSVFISLSKKGRNKLRQMQLSQSAKPLAMQWDGKWRMLVLDLVDEEKSAQDALRYLLKKAHFVQVKASIWVSPFPMEYMILDMKKDLGLSGKMMLFLIESFDKDTEEKLKELFLLSDNKKK